MLSAPIPLLYLLQRQDPGLTVPPASSLSEIASSVLGTEELINTGELKWLGPRASENRVTCSAEGCPKTHAGAGLPEGHLPAHTCL